MTSQQTSILIKPSVEISIPELTSFAYRAEQSAYPIGQGNVPEVRLWTPGNTEYEYRENGFYYRDSYSGYLRLNGCKTIKICNDRGLTAWSMLYRGGIAPPFDEPTKENIKFASNVFQFLRRASANTPEHLPFCREGLYEEEFSDFKCACVLMERGFTEFSGSKVIFQENTGVDILRLNFQGGIVIHK